MPTTTTKEFVLPVENKPGTFGDIASALGKASINISGYLVEAQGDYGILRLVTSDPAKTETWLKSTNRPYRTNEILTVAAPNNPGELGKLTTKLAQSGVNILSSYVTVGPNNQPSIAFAVDNLASAKKILG